jgi:hypothetical protein
MQSDDDQGSQTRTGGSCCAGIIGDGWLRLATIFADRPNLQFERPAGTLTLLPQTILGCVMEAAHLLAPVSFLFRSLWLIRHLSISVHRVLPVQARLIDDALSGSL